IGVGRAAATIRLGAGRAAARADGAAARGRHAAGRVARTAAAEVTRLHVLREDARPRQLQRPLPGLVVDLAEREVAIDVGARADAEHHVLVATLVRDRPDRPEDAADPDLHTLAGLDVVGGEPD